MDVFGFQDLNISVKPPFNENWERICELGYRLVAINQTVDFTSFESKKKKKSGKKEEIIPEPYNIDLIPSDLKRKLRVLNRLTVIISDPFQLHLIYRSPNYKKYHIFAVIPCNQTVFQYICSSGDVDIIGYNAENKLPIKLSRKMYNLAVSKQTFFELEYAPAILDSTHRKNIIHVAHLYHAVGQSKNIIVSSGATSFKQLRGAYDIVNLGLILGLNEAQSKQALTRHCWDTVRHAVSRRQGKAPINIKWTEDADAKMQVDVDDEENGALEEEAASAPKRIRANSVEDMQ